MNLLESLICCRCDKICAISQPVDNTSSNPDETNFNSNKHPKDEAKAWSTGRTSPSHSVANIPVSSEYNMNHRYRGLALIFNHETFNIPSNPTLDVRKGTAVDCDNLVNTLQNLDFKVQVFKDLCLFEIQQQVQAVAQMDHSENDCLAFVILSHGDMDLIYAKDSQYKLDTIWAFLTANKCPSLAGKPKLFFIQACQGNQLDDGITLVNNQTETDNGRSALSYTIPFQPDFLIAYSTIPGFYSWRNPLEGSWFIQSLCSELNQYGRKYDILTLLTFVCRRVATDFESNYLKDLQMHQKRQIPCIMSMLTRILKFGEK